MFNNITEDTHENQCDYMLSPKVEDIPTPFDYKHEDTDLSLLLYGEFDTANLDTKRSLDNAYTGPDLPPTPFNHRRKPVGEFRFEALPNM